MLWKVNLETVKVSLFSSMTTKRVSKIKRCRQTRAQTNRKMTLPVIMTRKNSSDLFSLEAPTLRREHSSHVYLQGSSSSNF